MIDSDEETRVMRSEMEKDRITLSFSCYKCLSDYKKIILHFKGIPIRYYRTRSEKEARYSSGIKHDSLDADMESFSLSLSLSLSLLEGKENCKAETSLQSRHFTPLRLPFPDYLTTGTSPHHVNNNPDDLRSFHLTSSPFPRHCHIWFPGYFLSSPL